MKKSLPLALLCAVLASTSTVTTAEELATCDDLTELDTALEETLVHYQENVGNIATGDEIEVTLDQLMQAASVINLGGQEQELLQNITLLQQEWNDPNSTAFSNALTDVTSSLDALRSMTCS